MTDTHATGRRDGTDIEFIAIDPPGARDLDQALYVEQRPAGFRLHYAIADLGAFITPDGPTDVEARRRGVTVYMGSRKVPLHPTALSEGKASLLADGAERPALWWQIDFDRDGTMGSVRLERARVRCREAISYAEAQRRIDGGADEMLMAMAALGRARQAQEVERGGVSLELPEQEVEVDDAGHVHLQARAALAVEKYNAQMSLATGIAAAHIMIEARVGILRTMPPPDSGTLDRLRSMSEAVGVPWPESGGYPAWVRSLDPSTPIGASLMFRAAAGMRGAGYTVFDNTAPELSTHAAVASPYAHVTAPLRRLVDRFANEVLLAATAGRVPPEWVLSALGSLPETMRDADKTAKRVERAVVDLTEAAIMASMSGASFRGVVLEIGRGRATVALDDMAVIVEVDSSGLSESQRVTLTVASADPMERRVTLVPTPGT